MTTHIGKQNILTTYLFVFNAHYETMFILVINNHTNAEILKYLKFQNCHEI